MTISKRLRAARAHLGLKQSEVAEQSGVSERAYQGYEAGRSFPGGEAIEGFVKLGINANWLLTGEGPMLTSELLSEAIRDLKDVASLQRILDGVRAGKYDKNKDGALALKEPPTAEHNGFVAIPMYEEIEASAGHGVLPPDVPSVQVLKFSEGWIRHELRAAPSDLYLIHVDGDSMEPTLRSGDVILVDHRITHPNREGVYILRMDGALLVKRLQFRPGEVIDVISDNKEYNSFSIKLADMAGLDFVVLGKVVWSGRRM